MDMLFGITLSGLILAIVSSLFSFGGGYLLRHIQKRKLKKEILDQLGEVNWDTFIAVAEILEDVEKLGTSIKSSYDSYLLVSEKLGKNQWDFDKAQVEQLKRIGGDIKKLKP